MGLRFNVGSDSDHPFQGIREDTVRLSANYHTPSGPRNAWLFFLTYSNNQHFLNGVPVPGVAYYLESPAGRGPRPPRVPLPLDFLHARSAVGRALFPSSARGTSTARSGIDSWGASGFSAGSTGGNRSGCARAGRKAATAFSSIGNASWPACNAPSTKGCG